MDDSLDLQAEVISIGDELTSGQRLDTNSQWLSQRLSELGIRTIRHSTVGDDLPTGIETLRLAAGRAHVVVVSGGLGPTQDDLTRQTLADAFDCPLELDSQSLADIREMFTRRYREMPERNYVQAMFPRGAQVIPNPHGTAPGIDLAVETNGHRSRIFSLPGVPAELKQMWTESVVQRIEDMLGGRLEPWRYYAVKLFGIGESDVEVRLPSLIERQRTPMVGITVSTATITLRIAARAQSDEQFAEMIAPTLNEIQQGLGELIFGTGEDELQHVVSRLLTQHQLTLACVEIGAASWISPWMLDADAALHESSGPAVAVEHSGESTGEVEHKAASGFSSEISSDFSTGFVGGLTFPTLAQAVHWCAGQTVDGAEPWERLVRQAQQQFSADVVLLVCGYPTVSQVASSDGTFDFDFALAIGDSVMIEHRSLGGHPDVLAPRAAKVGLDWLRKKLTLFTKE